MGWDAIGIGDGIGSGVFLVFCLLFLFAASIVWRWEIEDRKL